MQILSHLFYSRDTDKHPAMEMNCLQFDNREGWFHGCLGATGFCLFWKKSKVDTGSPALSEATSSLPHGRGGQLWLSQCAHWWAECWISLNCSSRAIIISGTHQCARDGSRPWRPAPNVASIFPCKAPWDSAVGKVGHWDTFNVLLQNYLTYPDLLEAGGWTQWLSEVPCKLHFPSNPWCNEGAEHSAGGAYSLPALCCLTAPYGIGKCRNNWELAAKQDMAVSQEWQPPATWEIILSPAGLSPSPVGGAGTYTLYCTK